MKAMHLSLRACLLGLLCLTLAAGCGKSSAKLVPVRGKVTVDGQPLTSGQVSLVPQGDPKEQQTAGLSTGGIDSNGEYKIFTNAKEGAPTGKYKVVVAPMMLPSADNKAPPMPFNSKYSDANKTDLQLEVVASPSAGQYDLKLSQ